MAGPRISEEPSWTFRPEPSTVGSARAEARAFLTAWGLDHLAFEVELVISELTTNAVLHAGTTIDLKITHVGEGVRIEVRDQNNSGVVSPTLVPQEFGGGALDDDRAIVEIQRVIDDATTGHGLRLVDELVDAWGVEGLPGFGKVVWAEIGTGRTGPSNPSQPARSTGANGNRPRVRLIAAPVRLILESELNIQSYLREARLDGVESHLRSGTATLLRQLRSTLQGASWRRPMREEAGRAATRGERLVDVNLLLPEDAEDRMRHLYELLDRLEPLSRSGSVATLEASGEVKDFRRWMLWEIGRQLAGGPPQPCAFPVSPHSAVVPERIRSTLSAERQRVLNELDARLYGGNDLTSAARIAIAFVVDELNANTGAVLILESDNETVVIFDTVGYPPEVATSWRRFALSADLPASEAIRTGRPVILRTLAERDERYPVFTRSPVLTDPAFVSIPFPGDIRGAIVLGFAASRDFDNDELAFLGAIAALVGRRFTNLPRPD